MPTALEVAVARVLKAHELAPAVDKGGHTIWKCLTCDGFEVEGSVRHREAQADHQAAFVLKVLAGPDPGDSGDRTTMSNTSTTEILDLVAELVEIIDPEEGSWPQDLSICPYYRRGLPDADPEGTCGFDCHDEPQCQTCRPLDGWPLERARALLALRSAASGETPT